MAFKQEVNVPLILVVGIISGILVMVILVGVEAWYNSEEQAELAIKQTESPNQWLIDLKAQEKQNIESPPHWADTREGTPHDPGNHIIVIPVSQAMDIMVQTQGRFPATLPSTAATRPATAPGAPAR